MQRLDDEKELTDVQLSKDISVLNDAEYIRLLSGQVDIFNGEMDSFISLWQQIELKGPITKTNYQQIKARYTDELVLQNLAWVGDNADNHEINRVKLS